MNNEGQDKNIENKDKYESVGRVLTKVYKITIISAVIISICLIFFYNPYWPFLKGNKYGLYVYSNPKGAQVYINGHNTFKKTPCEISLPHPGDYHITIAKNGYANRFHTVVRVESTFYRTVYADLLQKTPSSTPSGKLIVNTNPEGSGIEINGIYEGRSPMQVELKEGRYDIFVRPFDEFLPVLKTVSIKNSRISKITFNLQKMPEDKKLKWQMCSDDLPKQSYVNIGAKRIFVSPFDSNVMFLSVEFRRDSIIYRSIDGGKHWHILKYLPVEGDLPTIFFSHKDPSLFYMVWLSDILIPSAYNKIYKSTDLGQTWEDINLPYRINIYKFAVSPKDDNILYASGRTKEDKFTFLVSLNGGKTWNEVKSLPAGSQVVAFDISESNPNIMYAINIKGNLFAKSDDAGKSWNLIYPTMHNTTYPDIKWMTIRINPNNSNDIYIKGIYVNKTKEDESSEEKVVLFHSSDGGEHFYEIPWPFERNFGFLDFVITSDGTLYMSNYGSKNIFVYKNGKTSKINIDEDIYHIYLPNYKAKFPFVSSIDNYKEGIGESSYKIIGDKAVSLDEMVYNLGFLNVSYPHFSGQNGQELYAIIGHWHLMKTNDLGKHWTFVYDIPHNTKDLTILSPVFKVYNDKFYILDGKTLLVSNDYGKHFTSINLKKSLNNYSQNSNNLVVNTKNENDIVMYDDQNLFISNNGGKSFKTINTHSKQVNIGEVKDVAFLNVGKTTIIYALTINGLYRSNNYGNSWEKLSISHYTDYSTPIAFAVVPSKNPFIVVLTRNGFLYKSTDTGTNFHSITANLYGKPKSTYEPAKFYTVSENNLFLIIPNSGIYESSNGGYAWKNIIGHSVKDCVFDFRTNLSLLHYNAAITKSGKFVMVIGSPIWGICIGQ